MEELKKNQENQTGKHGGVRPGSGRPKGSSDKPKLSDNLTQEEKDEIVLKLLEKARGGDSKILQFLAEQIFGKAPQSLDVDANGKFILEIAKTVADKNE